MSAERDALHMALWLWLREIREHSKDSERVYELADNAINAINGRNEMQPHQQRVVSEKAELDERIDKLTAFIDTPIFAGLDVAEQERLVRQLHHMGMYTAVLAERIRAFAA